MSFFEELKLFCKMKFKEEINNEGNEPEQNFRGIFRRLSPNFETEITNQNIEKILLAICMQLALSEIRKIII